MTDRSDDRTTITILEERVKLYRDLLDEVMRCTVSDGEYEIGAMLDDVDDIRGRVEGAIGRRLSP